MSFAKLHVSPSLETEMQPIIALLWYDIANSATHPFNETVVSRIFHESLEAASQNILRSEKTRTRLLKALQKKSLQDTLASVRMQSSKLPEGYFIDAFSKVISLKNASRIVPAFIEQVRQQFFAQPELMQKIMDYYQPVLFNGAPETEEDFYPPPVSSINESPEQPSPRLYTENPNSGQLPEWDESVYALPLRGMRKIEEHFQTQSTLFMVGQAGCGKTTLISAYLHNLIAQGQMKPENVFYYRFVTGLSDGKAFRTSLERFLQNRCAVAAAESWENLPQCRAIFVIDDLQAAEETECTELIQRLWNVLNPQETAHAKLLVISQEMSDELNPTDDQLYIYTGLSLAEGNALVGDKWALEIPVFLRRALVAKLKGIPPLLWMFKNWWMCENHTDTQLERLVEKLPSEERSLYGYMGQHLYEIFERVDPRINSMLTTASIFRNPETEPFYERMYNRIGGGDFQQVIEMLVEQYHLLTFDDHLNRYEVVLPLKSFYYHICTPELRRIMHGIAAELYRDRAAVNVSVRDWLESAHHFSRAGKEEEAADQVGRVLQSGNVNGSLTGQIFNILKNFQLENLQDEQLKMHILFNRSQLFYQMGELDLAERDLQLCEALKPPRKMRGALLFTYGKIARIRNEKDMAVRFLRGAYKLFFEVKDAPGAVRTAIELADLLIEIRQTQEALELLLQMVPICEKVGDKDCIERMYSELGAIYLQKSEWDNALSYYEKLLQLRQTSHSEKSMVDILDKIGLIHEQRGEWDAAIEQYYESLQLKEKQNDWKGLAQSYERIGKLYYKKGQWELAVDFYQEAQELYETHNDPRGLAEIYMQLGEIYRSRDEQDLAMGFYQKSQEIYERIEDVDGIATTYEDMGLIFRAQKDWERALDMFEKALQLREKIQDTVGAADIYAHIGDTYYSRGETEYAISVYERCINMKEELGDIAGAAQIFYNMGVISKDEDRFEQAIEQFKNALTLFEQVHNLRGVGRTLQSLGSVYQKKQEWEECLKQYMQAKEVFQENGDLRGLAEVNYLIGTVHHDKGEWKEALESYQNAYPLYEKIGDLSGIAQTIGNISAIEFEQGEHTRAILRQIEILLYFDDQGRSERVDKVLANLVACHQELGAEVFQPTLRNCLDQVARQGVTWGKHRVLQPEKTSSIINRLFPNT